MPGRDVIFDGALEQNRRCAWARYYSTRAELEAERMRSAELAVWIEALDLELPGEDSPLRQLIDQALVQVKSHDLGIIRRYVHHQLLPT